MKKMSYDDFQKEVQLARLCASNFMFFNGCPDAGQFANILRLSMVEVEYPQGITWATDPCLKVLGETRTLLSRQRNKWLKEHDGGSDASAGN